MATLYKPNQSIPITIIFQQPEKERLKAPWREVSVVFRPIQNFRWTEAIMVQNPTDHSWTTTLNMKAGLWSTRFRVDGYFYMSPTDKIGCFKHGNTCGHHWCWENFNQFVVKTVLQPSCDPWRYAGIMGKRGGTIHTWKNRYMELAGLGLSYYAPKDTKNEVPAPSDALDTDPIDTLNLLLLLDKPQGTAAYKSKEFCFELKFPGRTYFFNAPSKEIMDLWLDHFTVAATRMAICNTALGY